MKSSSPGAYARGARSVFNKRSSRIPRMDASRLINKISIKAHYFRCQESQAGFTLLEVMVAVSIMAIVLTAVYRMHFQSILMHNDARFYTFAPLLAQSRLANFELESLKEQTNAAGDFGDSFTDYKWSLSIEDVESEALGDTAKDLKKVDITVSLNNDESSYSLRAYRFARD